MNKAFYKRNSTGGYILILNAMLFVSITFLLVVAIVAPLISTSEAATALTKSTQAFVVGNSAVEESLYRLKQGYDLNATEVIELGNATATIAVASASDQKTIRVDTENDDYFRNIETVVSVGAGVSFNYGLQAGRGGFVLGGGAIVNGNVYSNGDILGSGGPKITGGATVASQSNPVANQTSSGPTPPSNHISFGGHSTPQDFAQSFTVSTTTPVTSVRLYILRTTTGWMNDIDVYITQDDGGEPSKTKLATANIIHNQITTSYNHFSVPFTSIASLTPGETYWIVLNTSTSWGGYYSLGAAPNAYANGLAKSGEWRSNNGGSWSSVSPSNLDAYFDIYVGGDTGLISNVEIGQNGGDAWAYEVNQTEVYNGKIYCQSSTGNNQACDTSRPDPVEQPFPISDGNIEDWKDEAEMGTTTIGDVSYGGADQATIGPGKIVGDLTIGSGADIKVAGTLYVTGDIDVSGGATLVLDDTYGNNPGVIVTDGNVDLTGGGAVSGNGQPDSYVLVVTTSDCPDGPSCGGTSAIEVSGGTDSVILNAQKGTIEFVGGATANQATAYKIEMSGGTEINYISGIADVNFNSGPSGSWTIDSWNEI